MKSIIFATLAAYASAAQQFGNVAGENTVTGTTESTPIAVTSPAAEQSITSSGTTTSSSSSGTTTSSSSSGTSSETRTESAPVITRTETTIESDPVVAETSALHETETKINTTDFKDNADSKIAMDEFSWNNFDDTMFTSSFKDILDTLGNDDQVRNEAAKVKAAFVARYNKEAEALPKVCELGAICRKEIREQVFSEVQVEWQAILTSIEKVVKTTVDKSRTIMVKAYKDAFSCEPGCPCEFVENRYSYLLATVKEIDTSIAWYESEIAVRKGYVTELDTDCINFDAEFQIQWDVLEADFLRESGDIADWLNDDFELDSLVDQEAFKAKYNFEYTSSEFDRYFETADRGDNLNDYQRDVVEVNAAAAI